MGGDGVDGVCFEFAAKRQSTEKKKKKMWLRYPSANNSPVPLLSGTEQHTFGWVVHFAFFLSQTHTQASTHDIMVHAQWDTNDITRAQQGYQGKHGADI